MATKKLTTTELNKLIEQKVKKTLKEYKTLNEDVEDFKRGDKISYEFKGRTQYGIITSASPTSNQVGFVSYHLNEMRIGFKRPKTDVKKVSDFPSSTKQYLKKYGIDKDMINYMANYGIKINIG